MSDHREVLTSAIEDASDNEMDRRVYGALIGCSTTKARILDEAPHGSNGVRLECLLHADELVVIAYMHWDDTKSGRATAGMVSIFDVNDKGSSALYGGYKGQLRHMFMAEHGPTGERQVICWPQSQRAGADAAARLDAFVNDLYAQAHTDLTGKSSQDT